MNPRTLLRRALAELRPHAGPLAVFAALAGLFCAPVLPHPARIALGHPDNDVWNHIWGFWWVAQSLLDGKLPLHTDLVSWPAGGTLWFIDTFNALWTLPVTALFGAVASYNLAIFANFTLCGFAAYRLALRVARTVPGAVLSGVAYMSTPHLLGQAYNGISETLSAGWLPLVILALLDARELRTRRAAAWVGALFGICAVANWYYGLFAALVCGTVAFWDVAVAVRRRRFADLRTLVGQGVVALVAMGLVAGGPFALFYASMQAADAVVTRDQAFVWMTLIMHNMTDVVSLVRPGHVYSPDLKALFDEDLIVVVYLGHALLWPAVAVGFTAWRRMVRPWFGMALGFTLLTLGPFLYVAGGYVEIEHRWIALPFLWLHDALPMFSRISHAYRFVIGASLALSVMLAWTVRALGPTPRGAVLAAAGLGALRVGESLFGSPAVFPVPTSDAAIPALYTRLAEEEGALLDVPVSVPVLSRSRYSVYQLAHRRPIPYGLNDPSPPYLYANRYTRYLIELERSTVALLPTELPYADVALGQADATSRGLRWIVVHRDLYPPAQYLKVVHFLDLTATPTWDDGELRVYRLPEDQP